MACARLRPGLLKDLLDDLLLREHLHVVHVRPLRVHVRRLAGELAVGVARVALVVALKGVEVVVAARRLGVPLLKDRLLRCERPATCARRIMTLVQARLGRAGAGPPAERELAHQVQPVKRDIMRGSAPRTTGACGTRPGAVKPEEATRPATAVESIVRRGSDLDGNQRCVGGAECFRMQTCAAKRLLKPTSGSDSI